MKKVYLVGIMLLIMIFSTSCKRVNEISQPEIMSSSKASISDEERANLFVETATQDELRKMVTAAAHAWGEAKENDSTLSVPELDSAGLLKFFSWMQSDCSEDYLITDGASKIYEVPLEEVIRILNLHFKDYNFYPEKSIYTNWDSYDAEKKLFKFKQIDVIDTPIQWVELSSCENHGDGSVTIKAETQFEEMPDTEKIITRYGLDIRFSGENIYFEKFYLA